MGTKLDKLFHYISKLTNTKYWGKLTLSFENGIIVNVKREENIKLREL